MSTTEARLTPKDRYRALESWFRHTGASLLAAGTLVSAPFLLFALTYKTYIYSRTGHWYAWGAPTDIGVANRIISYALTINAVIGSGFLLTAAVMRAVRRRFRKHAATPTGRPRAGAA